MRQGGLNCKLVAFMTFLLSEVQSNKNLKPSDGVLLTCLTGSILKKPAFSPSLFQQALVSTAGFVAGSGPYTGMCT